jgi:hypothetical protein
MWRFTIRDLIFLNVIAAMGVAWILDHMSIIIVRDQFRQQAEDAEKDRNVYADLLERHAPNWRRPATRVGNPALMPPTR